MTVPMIDYINEQIFVIRGVKTIEINTRMSAQNGDNCKLSNVLVTRRTAHDVLSGFWEAINCNMH